MKFFLENGKDKSKNFFAIFSKKQNGFFFKKKEDWQQKIKNSNIKKRETSVKTWNKPGMRTTQGGKKQEIKHR